MVGAWLLLFLVSHLSTADLGARAAGALSFGPIELDGKDLGSLAIRDAASVGVDVDTFYWVQLHCFAPEPYPLRN